MPNLSRDVARYEPDSRYHYHPTDTSPTMTTTTTPAGDDTLLSARQIAPMLGYDESGYRAVHQLLDRAGLEPVYLSARRKRWWRSDVVGLLRRRAGAADPDRRERREQPASAPSRFRKKAS